MASVFFQNVIKLRHSVRDQQAMFVWTIFNLRKL